MRNDVQLDLVPYLNFDPEVTEGQMREFSFFLKVLTGGERMGGKSVQTQQSRTNYITMHTFLKPHSAQSGLVP